MDKFKIDIYNHLRDNNFKTIEFIHTFSGTYKTTETVEEIVDLLHVEEGIAIDMIKPQGETPLIRLELLDGQDVEEIIERLNKKNVLISEDKDDFEHFSEINKILSIEEISLGKTESNELFSFLNSEFPNDFKTITKTINIYEWGASGYFVNFIVNLAAGLSQTGLEKIYQFLKNKGYQYTEIRQFDIIIIKNFISKNYGVNPNFLKLSSTRTYGNSHTRFIFSTRYADYMVEIDDKNNIIESNVRNFSQTNI